MRMKRSRTRTLHFKTKKVAKDKEGVPNISYGAPFEFVGEIWSASSKLQVETYGDRVNSIMNCKIKGHYVIEQENGVTYYDFGSEKIIKEGDGLCVNVKKKENPDYRIISIKPYKPLLLEVEKL